MNKNINRARVLINVFDCNIHWLQNHFSREVAALSFGTLEISRQNPKAQRVSKQN